MAVDKIGFEYNFIGLSTDTKPTPQTHKEVSDGVTYHEADTDKTFVYCDGQWYEKTSGGGGGGTDFIGTDGTTPGVHGLVPAPATTDAGKFLKADGTWAESNSGVALTQAQYDALSDTEKDSDTVYYITDGQGGGGGDSQIHYSTDEQKIGTWIDGKDLYQKTFSIGTLPAVGSVKGIEHNITGLSMVIDIQGTITATSGLSRPIPFHESDQLNVNVYTTDRYINVAAGDSNWSAYNRNYVTIKYTKV